MDHSARSGCPQADWLKEMSGGLGDDEEEKVDEEKSVTLLKKAPKQKTRQQRRKMRERAVAERQRLATVSTRRSENEVFRYGAVRRRDCRFLCDGCQGRRVCEMFVCECEQACECGC